MPFARPSLSERPGDQNRVHNALESLGMAISIKTMLEIVAMLIASLALLVSIGTDPLSESLA